MTTINKHPDGRFCWNQIVTTDVDGAITFYTALFGWDVTDEDLQAGDEMVRLTHDGEFVLGINKAEQKHTDPDTERAEPDPTIHFNQGHWEPHVAMSDLSGALKESPTLGGTVLEKPTPAEEFGTMAEISGPSGARMSLWAAGTFGGHSLAVKNGRPAWYSLQLIEPGPASEFWAALMKWSSTTDDHGNTLFGADEQPAFAEAVVLNSNDWTALQEPAPRWLPYIQVADIDAICNDAEAINGTVLIPPADDSTGRRRAIIRDPQGGHFGVISPA